MKTKLYVIITWPYVLYLVITLLIQHRKITAAIVFGEQRRNWREAKYWI